MKRQNKNKNIIASGTGYYIAGDIINKFQGFPFDSLTEDYEFSLYATLNHIPGYYNTNAVFYDEQPTDKKTTYTQRSRWCKGFQETRKKYMKEIKLNKRNISIYHEYIGVNHYISLIFVYALTLISSIALTIYNSINMSIDDEEIEPEGPVDLSYRLVGGSLTESGDEKTVFHL